MQVATHATTKATERPLRRVPVQGRSVARVARMLDACADLVDEVGCDGLTTTMLAERARVAIGSVYQFFPDKQAVIRALMLRNLEVYLDRLSARLEHATCEHWWDVLDLGIDEYAAMHREIPGFRTLHIGQIAEPSQDGEQDSTAVIAERLVGLMVERFGFEERAELRFAMTIAVEVSHALVRRAFRRDPQGDPALLAECVIMIREYLTPRLPATG